MVTKNLRDATLKIQDGSTPVNEIELALEDGELSYERTKNYVHVFDRGVYSHSRKGDEAIISGSFALKFVELIKQSGAADPTPDEMLNFRGAAASYASTNDDGGDVDTIKLIFEIPSPTAGEQAERTTFNKVAITKDSFEGGEEFDKLSYDFDDLEIEPTIAKYTP